MVNRKRSAAPATNKATPQAEADTPVRPTATHLQTGQLGEEAAAAYLSAKGMRILARNWRHKQLELDIIARDGETVVFAEVKTRDAQGMGSPHEALTRSKRQRLAKAASQWLTVNQMWDQPCRFDLVCVSTDTDSKYWHTVTLQDAQAAGAKQGKAEAGTSLGKIPLLATITNFFTGRKADIAPETQRNNSKKQTNLSDQSGNQIENNIGCVCNTAGRDRKGPPAHTAVAGDSVNAGPIQLPQCNVPGKNYSSETGKEMSGTSQNDSATAGEQQRSSAGPAQLFSVEHIPDAFELSQPVCGGNTAWQPW
ncbi:YraN family protein [Oleidesulfovibrio sp.]|uniref:YraN family protein n=1 Tax=Oleidesulfovibrio sp. TaxID=2909707 RepID=UPI003A841967